MKAGTLELQLLTNLAKLSTDMDNAKRAVGNAMSTIDRSVAQVSQAMVNYAEQTKLATSDTTVYPNANAIAIAVVAARHKADADAVHLQLLLDDNANWLRARWADADRAHAAGTLANFAAWYFDPVTERQLERIHRDGISVSGSDLTKGKASDLIGLFEPVEEKHKVILRFFKVPLRGMNQSRAIYEVSKLFADTKNAEAWKLRPAEPMQKEFLRFLDMKCPKGLTCVEAERLINEYRMKLSEEYSQKLDEWHSFESIVTDLDDKEIRNDYEINKPTLSILRAAIDTLRKEGNSMDDLAGDLDMVVQKLIELKPELEKQR